MARSRYFITLIGVVKMTDKHFKFSMAKSFFRLAGCYGLWTTGDMLFMYIGILFGLAEILGILEEL
jgi:hypothetical protein